MVPVCTPHLTVFASSTVSTVTPLSAATSTPWFDSKYGIVNVTTSARSHVIDTCDNARS